MVLKDTYIYVHVHRHMALSARCAPVARGSQNPCICFFLSREEFFSKIIPPNSSFGAPEGSLSDLWHSTTAKELAKSGLDLLFSRGLGSTYLGGHDDFAIGPTQDRYYLAPDVHLKCEDFTGVVHEINHKICRFSIDDWRSAVILHRWISINRQYWPYSPVSESSLTIDINCDQSTGLINQWIGVDIWIGVGTISHHTWDHDFLVDVCPGPFLTTYGTIGQWSFFWTSRKNAVDQFFSVVNPHRRSISTEFSLNLTVEAISTVFLSRWISINRQYQPWRIVGASPLARSRWNPGTLHNDSPISV